MKLRNLFWIVFFSFLLILIVISLVVEAEDRKENFEESIDDYLSSSLLYKGERLDDFFYEIEQDSLFLANSYNVNEIFNKNIGESKESAVLDVSGKIDVVAKEVENYMKAHPEMSINDIKENKELELIAVQQVGRKGYSALQNFENKELYLHVNPEIIGADIEALGRRFSGLGKIFDDLDREGSASGFYLWEDSDGVIREKYGEFRKLSTKTADGIELVSLVTTYVEDYNVVQNVSKELEKYFYDFNRLRDYHNVLFLSPDGNIIYMAISMEGIGMNVEVARSGLNSAYLKGQNLGKGEIGFYGPFVGHIGSKDLQIAIMSKVYHEDKFTGTLMIIKNTGKINDILEEGIYGVENEDVYLINEEFLLITKLASRDVGVLTQGIFTEGTEECLGDFEDAKEMDMDISEYQILEHENISRFLDFKGDEVLGLDFPIGKINWCLLSEVNVEEIINVPLREDLVNMIKSKIWFWIALILGILGGGFLIDKKYVLISKREKMIWRLPNFLKKSYISRINLFWFILMSSIFAISYFFIVTSFFQGWQNAKFFDDIPDLMIFIMGFLLAVYSLKIKNERAGVFVFFGGIFIALERLIEIPFQEYQVSIGSTLNPFIWLPIVSFGFLGYLLLLIGFGRIKDGL